MRVLDRFRADVIDRGAEACLPRNLSNRWLTKVADAAKYVLENESDEMPDDANAIALAAALCLLSGKHNTPSVQVGFGELFEYLQLYRTELLLELLHRNTDLRYEPATLETIFTDREIVTWREPFTPG
ncbi:MAG: hypothetical protein QM767_11310 [Anaeromyxobacter sp.]